MEPSANGLDRFRELLTQLLALVESGALQVPGTDRSQLEDIPRQELQFLRLVCDPKEYTYPQIADIMGIARGTLDTYRRRLWERFGIQSKTGMVIFAAKVGLV